MNIDKPIKPLDRSTNFGDLTVIVILDCSPDFQGLEDITAVAIQRFIAAPAPGKTSVYVQRLGIDVFPRYVSSIEPHYLRVVGTPGLRAEAIAKREHALTDNREVVIGAFHGLNLCPRTTRLPTHRSFYPIIIGCGMPVESAQEGTGVPKSHIAAVTPELLPKAWSTVYDLVQNIRCLANPWDARTYDKLSIPSDLQTFPYGSHAEYFRKCGLSTRESEQYRQASIRANHV